MPVVQERGVTNVVGMGVGYDENVDTMFPIQFPETALPYAGIHEDGLGSFEEKAVTTGEPALSLARHEIYITFKTPDQVC